MRYYFITVILSVMVALCAVSAVTAAETDETEELTQPAVDREASEEAFLKAYEYLLQNRLWNCLDELAESLRENVYFIDAYYMRSLAFRRLGRYTDAIDAMSQYLEVRRDDNRAKVILDAMRSEWELIRGSISPRRDETDTYFTVHTINQFLGIQPYEPLAVRGMSGAGKIAADIETIIACDTLGDRIWIFDRKGNLPPQNVALPRPSTSVMQSSTEALVFSEDGRVFRMSLDASNRPMLQELGDLETNICDAAAIDSTYLAVADRRGGVVRFIGMPDLNQATTWSPPDSGEGKLFEPVAVSAFGSLLAIADRGTGRVFVIDSHTLAMVDNFEVEYPRDLAWGDTGDLLVLNENGTLYSRYPVGSESAELNITVDGMNEAWSLSRADDGIVVTSVSGRTWWMGRVRPGRSQAFGSVAMHSPWIETRDGVEFLMLRCAVSSAFPDFIQSREPFTQVVWRGEVRPSRVVSIGAARLGDREGAVRYFAPGGGVMPDGARIMPAEAIADVMRDMSELSRGGNGLPSVIVLDSRISGSDGQVELFLAFLQRQGIRLDLWQINRPASITMNRVSRITGGRSYYLRYAEARSAAIGIEWILSLPLPPDITTFGYPSDTTLSLFSEIDAIRFSDWIPVWPSLMWRNNVE